MEKVDELSSHIDLHSSSRQFTRKKFRLHCGPGTTDTESVVEEETARGLVPVVRQGASSMTLLF